MTQALNDYSASEQPLDRSLGNLRLRFMGRQGFLRVDQEDINPL